jgi:hypothetical protein
LPFGPAASAESVADGEICSRPAFASDLLADATPPDVAGPRTAATCESEMNFCATFAGALLDGRVAADDLDLQLELRAERLRGVLRPRELLVADGPAAAGERRQQRKLDRPTAVDRRDSVGRRRPRTGGRRERRGNDHHEGDDEPSSLVHPHKPPG